MSNLGHFNFVTSAELHLVNSYGESCPINDEMLEAPIEVTCEIHIDDPEDGPYGKNIEATLEGTDIDLNEEAIDFLELSRVAGEVFWESEPTSPKIGSQYMSIDGAVWEVVGSGKHYRNTTTYTLLEKVAKTFPDAINGRGPFMTVEVTEFNRYDYVDGELVRVFRPVIKNEPGENEFKMIDAVYPSGE